ncbi:ADP-ribose glycohydrolase OARD1-like [Anopheles aquasalis]|uniref:ADP-ribose glycohydrolase OARD1-like n=1 Tax=Anopheles aquasalis TaxID=42839 RepID=UPI00215ADDB7|nr:ADP-ribose glycohydrolase OARD1-like [Anopheles aquasalis]
MTLFKFITAHSIHRSLAVTRNPQRFCLELYRKDFPAGCSRTMTTTGASCVRETEGDLFGAPKDHSLAHCVAADLKMGGGIAVKFKQVFGKVDDLKAQMVGVGGVAVLYDPPRYVYYLVTKNSSYQKPTYADLRKSLEAMRQHMAANGVGKLAIPRIGCGIDGLEWDKVKEMLNSVFADGDIGKYEIVVYNFVPK